VFAALQPEEVAANLAEIKADLKELNAKIANLTAAVENHGGAALPSIVAQLAEPAEGAGCAARGRSWPRSGAPDSS
jgi:hypothetical protein